MAIETYSIATCGMDLNPLTDWNFREPLFSNYLTIAIKLLISKKDTFMELCGL